MHIYPKTRIKLNHRLKHISSSDFHERARELASEFNGTGSFVSNKLYLRRKNAPFELELEVNNDSVTIETGMLWGYKFIIRMQIIMCVVFMTIGFGGSNLYLVSFLGFIGYILITFLANSRIKKTSSEYLKLIKSLDYDLNE